jgi:hypothetical protein
MVRSFDETPVDQDWLDARCADALWSPSAGNAAGVRMHTIRRELIGAFFDVATDEAWRASSRRAPGLARAGGAVLITTRPRDYLERYAQSDKVSSGLADRSAWPVPYWHADAAMATMALLLLIEEGGWQATIWGNFRNDAAVLEWARLSDEELFATVLVGRADGLDVASSSLEREVLSRSARVSRVLG